MLPSQLKSLAETLRTQLGAIHEAINQQTNATEHEHAANREKIQGTVGALRSIADDIQADTQQGRANAEHAGSQQERLITAQNRLVVWSALAFFAATGYATVAAFQLCTSQHQLREMRRSDESANRPWIGFDNQNGAVNAIESVGNVTVSPDGTTGMVTLTYRLSNVGHSPAKIRIEAKVVEVFQKEATTYDRNSVAQSECRKGWENFPKEHPLTLIPGAPTLYSISYDGKPYENSTQHAPAIKFRSRERHHWLLNVGCIVYQDSDGGPRYTPFVSALTIDGEVISGQPDGPYTIGNAD